MYLWRSLPDGQLLAVLRWLQARRQSRQPAKAAFGPKTETRPPAPATPPSR